MKTKKTILGCLLLLLIFTASSAFADFYVIAGSHAVGTKITSLPYTISSSGFYFITKDLSCAAGSHGITITADNVTLDLMGFSIVGPEGINMYDGIYMSAKKNIEIRNGTVRNFSRGGINEKNDGEDHRIINMRIENNHGNGIRLMSKNNLVEKCTVADNGGHGIYINIGSTVIENVCYNNGGSGIASGATGCCTITGNTCYDNDQRGIYATNSCTVTGNTCCDNTNQGISVGSGSTVIGNTCQGNTGYGIDLGGYNLVDQNTAYNNTAGDINSCATCKFGNNIGETP